MDLFRELESGKNHGFHLMMSAHRLQGQIALAVRQCSVFGGTSVVWCTHENIFLCAIGAQTRFFATVNSSAM